MSFDGNDNSCGSITNSQIGIGILNGCRINQFNIDVNIICQESKINFEQINSGRHSRGKFDD